MNTIVTLQSGRRILIDAMILKAIMDIYSKPHGDCHEVFTKWLDVSRGMHANYADAKEIIHRVVFYKYLEFQELLKVTHNYAHITVMDYVNALKELSHPAPALPPESSI